MSSEIANQEAQTSTPQGIVEPGEPTPNDKSTFEMNAKLDLIIEMLKEQK